MKDIMIVVLPLIGVVAGILLQYFLTRSKDQEDQRDLRRQQAYADYLKSVAGVAHSNDKTFHTAQLADSKARIVIYGSSAVILKLADFERVGACFDNDKSITAFLSAVQQMRKDHSREDIGLELDDLRKVLFNA